MNNFRKEIKVSKEQLEYEEYKRKRFANEVHKPIWKGEER